MSKQLLAGEAELSNGLVATEREWAADILREVADVTTWGGWSADVSAFDLGRALGRSLLNCNEDDALAEVLRGFNYQRRPQ